MSYKDPIRRKEYSKKYRQEHIEDRKTYIKSWRKENKDKCKEYNKAYRQAHPEYSKEYNKKDVNSFGKTKASIRTKSQRYLSKYGTKIKGYQIHHCCTYTEPYKFIYCSREMHNIIHSYLRQHNIDADSDHYEQIKHLLDDTVVKYGI